MENKFNFEVFSKENLGSVRVVLDARSEEPKYWFVAKDVCSCLGQNNVSQACVDLLDDEKSAIILNDTRSKAGSTQSRKVLIVSESGMYMLIMRSRKPEAIAFQRWITREVLPAIRKNGSYSLKEQSYKEDANHWYEMYTRILDDYVKDVKRRREEPKGSKVTTPDASKVNNVYEICTNNQMFVIEPEGKYTIIEREMR